MCPIIEMKGAGVVYRPTRKTSVAALSDVSVRVARGCFTVVEGPSGSGKSSFLHLAVGLQAPTVGDVMLFGVHVSKLSASDRSALWSKKIGFVYQAFNLLPFLNARENVELPMMLQFVPGGSQRRARAMRCLELVGLDGLGDRLPSQLSGGEQQRVAIARSIVNEPELLVADEPTGNLDDASAGIVLGLLKMLQRDLGVTVVVATHDPRFRCAADQIIELEKGCVVSQPCAT
jgi:putative ABC transport system ATP-binding protein